MITLTTPFTPEFTPYLPPELRDKRAIYFDIETTGLSAQSSYVYLIGCAYEEDGIYYLTQWMCTEPSEEKELLRLFFDKVMYCKSFSLIQIRCRKKFFFQEFAGTDIHIYFLIRFKNRI